MSSEREHCHVGFEIQQDAADGLDVRRTSLCLLRGDVHVAQPALEGIVVKDRGRAGGVEIDGGRVPRLPYPAR